MAALFCHQKKFWMDVTKTVFRGVIERWGNRRDLWMNCIQFSPLFHCFHHLADSLLLLQGQIYPVFKQFFEFRVQLHHLVFSKELGKRDTEPGTDCLQGRNRGNSVPSEHISNGGCLTRAFTFMVSLPTCTYFIRKMGVIIRIHKYRIYTHIDT